MNTREGHVCCVCLGLAGSMFAEKYRTKAGEIRCYSPCELHEPLAEKAKTYIFRMPKEWYHDTTNQILAILCGDDTRSGPS